MKLALIDVETTGCKPSDDRVIDIGIVLVDGDKIVEEWESLVNPECVINPFITKLTGISDLHVYNAPTFAGIHQMISQLLEDRIFVAHNAGFDYSFIKHEYLRLDKPFQAPRLCTVKLSRLLNPKQRRHNLDSLVERLNLTIENRHRALPDAKAIFLFLQSWRDLHGADVLEEKIKEIAKRPALPPNVPTELINKLSSSVGVYTFYNEEGTALYIGKSVNIKDRVLSHFYRDISSSKDLHINQEVRHIESISTAGELEALLLESRLIKEIQPVYNRKLRKSKKVWLLKKHKNPAGYYQLNTENVQTLSYQGHEDIELICRSKSQLSKQLKDLCDRHLLCPKLCGIEQGTGACFSYHLDSCGGACVGKESSAAYNRRVFEAFDNTAIADWPFDGPIVIHERNEAMDMDAYHIINNWSVLKTARTMEDLVISVHLSKHSIDIDEYGILKNYLAKNSTKPGHVIVLGKNEQMV